MIKRTLIVCYLVLCTFFSLAQEGEVVLEIPMEARKGIWGNTTLLGSLIANEDKTKYALLLRDSEDFHLLLLNQHFQNDKKISLIEKKKEFKKYGNLLEGFFVGEECRFVFSDNNKEQFKMLIFNTQTEEVQFFDIPLHLGNDGGMEDDYVQSFQMGDKYYFMTTTPRQPIIQFFAMDVNKKIERLTFNLSKDFPKKQLWEFLNLSKKEVIKVDESTHIDLVADVSNNKLYIKGDKIMMSMATPSKVLTFDLSSKTYQVKEYQPLPMTIYEGEKIQRNMLIYKDKVYQIGISRLDLTLSIKTLQDSLLYKYRLQNSSSIDREDIIFRNGAYFEETYNDKIYDSKAIQRVAQFLKRAEDLNKNGGVSLVMNEIENGQTMFTIGIIKRFALGSGGYIGGGAPIMGSMGTPMGSVPIVVGRTASYFSYGNSGYGYESAFFDAILDEKAEQPIKRELEHHFYKQFRAELSSKKYQKMLMLLPPSKLQMVIY